MMVPKLAVLGVAVAGEVLMERTSWVTRTVTRGPFIAADFKRNRRVCCCGDEAEVEGVQ